MGQNDEGAVFIPLPEGEKVNIPLGPLELSLVGPWEEVARVQAVLEQLDPRFALAAAIKYGSVGSVDSGLSFFLWRLANTVEAEDLLGGPGQFYTLTLHDPDKALAEGRRIIKDRSIRAYENHRDRQQRQKAAGQKPLFAEEPITPHRNTPRQRGRNKRKQ